jgi:outer membrane protein OmpA-like peptidoglycan-associated protein
VIRRAAFLALLLPLLTDAACRRAPEPATPAKPIRSPNEETTPIAAPVLDIDGDNLLNLAYGAAVVSRSGELNLETSAVQAIDGLSFTAWSSSPGSPSQSLVFSLGGPSQIEQLGVTTTLKEQAPEKVRFAGSIDGKTWREITTFEPENRGTKIVPVTPFEARFLRIETIEKNEYYAALASVHAIGRELRPAERLSFDGCWTINTYPAMLVQRGARVTGVIGGTKHPMYVDGGVEGRVAKLMWMRGPMWGYAAATLTPGARGITAITFHEDPRIHQQGEAWIGDRCEQASINGTKTPADYVRRTGRWMMSGIVFDGEEQLIEEPSRDTLDAAAALLRAAPAERFRIVAREFRQNDANENLRRTTARVDAVRAALRARGIDVARIDFVSDGSRKSGVDMPSAIQRALWSRIDLERIH